MASPNSRADLITYCKRQLGEPVLQVNIDDEQVNNVIDNGSWDYSLTDLDYKPFYSYKCYTKMYICV